MNYAKIIVKSNYDKKGDLVLRSYVRALKKIKANLLLEDDNAFIYGRVLGDGTFQELFTKRKIDYDDYEIVSSSEFFGLLKLSLKEMQGIKKVIENVIFNEKCELDFEVSSIEDLAQDRAVEFEAYDNLLSRVNPYRRLNEVENQKLYNGYNDFLYKIEELKIMKELNKEVENLDGYDINNYQEKKLDAVNDYEYLVFEIPKVLYKKR